MIMITGASSGLGAALAACYAKAGEALFLTGRNAARLEAVAAGAAPQAHETQIQTQTADLSDHLAVSKLFDSLPKAPKMLIHCAGSGYFGPIDSQDPVAIQHLLNNNISSCIFVLREAIKRYRDQALTLVVVMSSAAQTAKVDESSYCAAKWAVKGFISALRLELKGTPVKIIAVYPGGMDTDFWPTSGKQLNTDAFIPAGEAATMLQQALQHTDKGYVSDISIDRY